VGYRFMGDVNVHPGAPDGNDLPARGIRPLAVLPFDNRTGDEGLGWIERGLMALTIHLLGGTTGGRLVSPQTVLQALDGAPGDTRLAAAGSVRAATNAKVVAHVAVHALDSGLKAAVTWSEGTTDKRFDVRAPTAIGLAYELASAFARRLGLSPRHEGAGLLSASLALESLARGLEALSVQQWPKAAKLLDLAVELDPGNMIAQLELLRAHSNLGNPMVLGRSRHLLAQARRGNDRVTAARVCQHIGRMYLNRERPERGDVWLGRSLELASEIDDAEMTARTLMLRASVCISRLDHRRAHQTLERMYKVCGAIGNRMLPVAGLNMEAIAAMAEGDMEQALALCEDAIRKSRVVRTVQYLIDATANASWVLSRLGRLHEAMAYAQEALAAARINRPGPYGMTLVAHLCMLHYLARDRAAAVQALEQAEPEVSATQAPNAWHCLGIVALAKGDAAGAATLLRRVVHAHREAGDGNREEEALPSFIDALILAGLHGEAEAELRVACSARLNTADLRMHARLAQAQLARARGAAGQALELLMAMLQATITPLMHVWASIDAAWLLAEGGDIARAQQLLGDLPGSWQEHPLVLSTQARVCFAAGELQRAAALQRRCLEKPGHTAAPDHLALLALYEAPQMASTAGATTALPLPSLL
jgi:tetratricopeptide (TPR) repeat protein